jgi:SAM-dependent methyltransferase
MIQVPESRLAHRYLDGLQGIEIGGSALNPFGLNTINVDNIDHGIFIDSQLDMCGKTLPIDVIAQGDNLPFPDDYWDFVIASHVLEHFYDPIKSLKEWHRVIKNHGYIFLIVPHKERTFDKDRPRTTLVELIERHAMGAAPKEEARGGHYSVWITEDVLELINYLGENYQIIEIADVDDKVKNGFTVVVQVHK